MKYKNTRWIAKVASKARYELRALEEDVKNEGLFASATLTASLRMLPSFAIVRKSEGYTVLTACGGRRRCVRRPSALADSCDSESNVGTVVWKLETRLYGLRSAPKMLARTLETILTKAGCVSIQPDACLWTHTLEIKQHLRYHVDDLIMVGTRHRLGKCGG